LYLFLFCQGLTAQDNDSLINDINSITYSASKNPYLEGYFSETMNNILVDTQVNEGFGYGYANFDGQLNIQTIDNNNGNIGLLLSLESTRKPFFSGCSVGLLISGGLAGWRSKIGGYEFDTGILIRGYPPEKW